jgi:general L-amino acid transport system substrate-binding protein
MRIVSAFAAGAAAVVAVAGAGAAEAGQTFNNVKQKQFVQCGVNSSGLPGFATVDASNNWSGLDIDLCRAVAAAVLGDAQKVKFSPLNAKERFTALQSGEIDILARNTTWTSSRDSALGLDFVGVNYYDGQGFMAKKSLGVKSALELDGASVCVQSGTTTELNLADYFRSNNMKFNAVVYENNDEVNKAYEAGRCDVLTTDQSGLYSTRVKLANVDDHVVLPRSSPRSRSGRRSGTATTSGPTWCAGPSTPCSRPRSSASPPRTSTRSRARRGTPTSSASWAWRRRRARSSVCPTTSPTRS